VGQTSLNSSDIYVLKTDANGAVEWDRTYGGATSAETAHDGFQTADGGYVFAGQTNSMGTADFYLVKTNGSGDIVWTQIYHQAGPQWAEAVLQTSDGGYLLAGYDADGSSASTSDASNSGGPQGDMQVIKTDPSGTQLWSRTYGTSSFDETAWDLAPAVGGGYMLAGRLTNGLDGSTLATLTRIDGLGNILWEGTFQGARNTEAFAITRAADGTHVLAGSALSPSGDRDVYLVKTFNGSGGVSGTDTPAMSLLPTRLRLGAPWPNPSSGSVFYQLDLPRAGRVVVEIFDIRGALVNQLIDQELEAGRHFLSWSRGRRRLPAGTYFIRVSFGGDSQTRKVILVD
jgi:hypothetical protein